MRGPGASSPVGFHPGSGTIGSVSAAIVSRAAWTHACFEMLFSFENGVSGLVGIDMRTTGEDPGATIVPEYRLRAAIGYRF